MSTLTAPSSPPAAPRAARPSTNGHLHPLLAQLINDVLEPDREYHHYAHTPLAADPTALQDFVLASDGDDVDVAHAFDRLRWLDLQRFLALARLFGQQREEALARDLDP